MGNRPIIKCSSYNLSYVGRQYTTICPKISSKNKLCAARSLFFMAFHVTAVDGYENELIRAKTLFVFCLCSSSPKMRFACNTPNALINNYSKITCVRTLSALKSPKNVNQRTQTSTSQSIPIAELFITQSIITTSQRAVVAHTISNKQSVPFPINTRTYLSRKQISPKTKRP